MAAAVAEQYINSCVYMPDKYNKYSKGGLGIACYEHNARIHILHIYTIACTAGALHKSVLLNR